MNCPSCQAPVPGKSRFCVICGTPQAARLVGGTGVDPTRRAWRRGEIQAATAVAIVAATLGSVWVIQTNHPAPSYAYSSSSSSDSGYSSSGSSGDDSSSSGSGGYDSGSTYDSSDGYATPTP